jgi:type IV pilus assembly protein PilM
MPLIGIDIGSSAIKIVEVSTRSRKLNAIGMEILPGEAVSDGVIQDIEVVENALRTLLHRMNLNPIGRRASLVLPANKVEIKRVLIEKSSGELDDLMNHEAEQYFQGDLAELSFQYQELLGWCEEPGKVPMLMVGAQRETIDQWVDLVKSVGLRTGVIDCMALCMMNAFESVVPDAHQLVALVDVGASTTVLTLIFRGQLLFTKSFAIGSAEYSRRMMQEMAISLDAAEAMKLAVSQGLALPTAPVQGIIIALNEALIQELASALKLYFENSIPIPGVAGIGQIVLSGGGARTLGLEKQLSEALSLPVQILNPFSSIKVSGQQFDLGYLAEKGHMFNVATGLALRKLND